MDKKIPKHVEVIMEPLTIDLNIHDWLVQPDWNSGIGEGRDEELKRVRCLV